MRFGYFPPQGVGAVNPSPAIIDGEQVSQFYYDTVAEQWTLVMLGEVDQYLFVRIEVQTDAGVVELWADAATYVFSTNSTWTWTNPVGWQSTDETEQKSAVFVLAEESREPDTPTVVGDEPLALFTPGRGQYWLIIGTQAFVLTINGTGRSSMSWSRYTFPVAIDDWTILGDDLYLRAGDLIWRVDDEAIYDDQEIDPLDEESPGGTDVDIAGYVAWPYLDIGSMGQTKMMHGFDLVIDGACDVSFGYDQSDDSRATDPYSVTGDTLPGDMIPMPLSAPSVQLRLAFAPGQRWSWKAATLYVADNRRGS